MGPTNYVNAQEVLSTELLDELSKALDGRTTLLWVPSHETINRQRRARYIADLHDEGLTTSEIADRLLLSVRQVRRILEKQRAASLPSRPAGEKK